MSEWTEWSECNKSCGKGHTIRTRMVKLEPQFGGDPCPETIQRKKCRLRKCNRGQGNINKRPPKKLRGEGRDSKGRDDVNSEHPGWHPPSLHSELQRYIDNLSLLIWQFFPFSGFLSLGCKMRPWSSWTECTKLCGGGIQERLMIVKQKFKTAQLSSCKDRKEIRACNVHPC